MNRTDRLLAILIELQRNQVVTAHMLAEKFETLALYYINELNKYSLEQLRRKPSEEEWSLGQMYYHLLTASNMQLHAIEQCATGSAIISGKKTEMGEDVYKMGAFPPIQIKIPNRPGYTPENPTNKENLKQGLLQLIDKMKKTQLKLSSIPSHHTVAHPGLGHLCATEWFQLVYMHFAHHLHQKERLEKTLITDSNC